MNSPPPPQDPRGSDPSDRSGAGAGPYGAGAGSGAAGPAGAFGPPQGFGPPPGSPPPGGGYGAPGGGPGYGPPGYGPPPGQPGFPGQPPYGMAPQPPGGGNRGAKVAAIVVGAVLAAAVAVGGLVLWAGGDGGNGSAQAGADASPSPEGAGRPEAGGGAAPDASAGEQEPEPGPSAGGGSPAPSSPSGELVPFVVLEPGQCFDHPSLSSDVREVEIRSCDEPHNGEVIANDELTGSFSDEAELRAKVLELCAADAAKRLDSMPADGRMYYYYAIYPSLATYNLRGDDTISCSLTLSDSMDGPKLTAPLPD